MVESNFQRVNAGSNTFLPFDLGNHRLAAASDGAKFVKVSGHPILDDTAFLDGSWGIRTYRLLDLVCQFGQVVPGLVEVQEQGGLARFQLAVNFRDRGEGVLEGAQFSCIRHPQHDAAHHPFQVRHLLQRKTQPSPPFAMIIQIGNRFLPLANARQFCQWMQEPMAKKPRSHRGDSSVQGM